MANFFNMVIMASCLILLLGFGRILGSRYSAKSEDVRLNEAQIANITGRRRKGLY
jgi:hypothetical protein